MRLERKWRNPSSFRLLLLTEFLYFFELASDAASSACEFLLFHFDFFLVPRTGPLLRSCNLTFEELNVERLVLNLAQMKHASPLSQKSDLFLGRSIFPPLLKQDFDWATGGVVEASVD